MTRAKSAGKSRKKKSDKARTADRSKGVGYAQGHHASFDWRNLLPILIVIAGGAAYHNSYSGVFVLDDDAHIVNNARIKQILPLSETLSGRRPIVDLSLAVNYRFGELNTRGYHAFNLAVHLLAGLTLFGIVRRTLLRRPFQDHVKQAAPWLALAIALIWVVHPLQTQSVTYLIQRGESLMGLFYLLTVYCVIRGVDARYRAGWYMGAVVFCALGMGSKAVMVTAPLVVFLFDWTFLSRSFVEALRRRWGLYLGLGATLIVLGICGVIRGVLNLDTRAATVGFSYKGIAPLEYLATQFGVVAHYLKLSLWPDPLCLDYGWAVTRSLREIAAPGLIVVLLLALTIWGLLRRSWLGFAGAWFFLILSPTSSFIPIKDPAFEHRMYLPLAAVVVVIVAGGYAALQAAAARMSWAAGPRRLIAAGAAAVVVALSIYGTIHRNRDYHDDLVMWRDVLSKRPENPRAHLGMGTALFEQGKSAKAKKESAEATQAFVKAEAEFATAVRLKPTYADAHYNLGNALAENGKLDEAEAAYRRSLQLRGRYPKSFYNLGNTLKKLGRRDEAIEAYQNAVRLNPDYLIAYINLGNTLQLQGRIDESVEAYRKALGINPRYANTHFNLGRALRLQGKLVEALEEFRLAYHYNPNHPSAKQSYDALRERLDQREPD